MIGALLGGIIGFFRRNLWALLIIAIIAPSAAGAIVVALYGDWLTFWHHIHPVVTQVGNNINKNVPKVKVHK